MVGAARAALLLAGAITLCAARRHPIHAARIELDAPTAGVVTATVRVYRDDFAGGIKLAEIERYLDRTLVLTDGHAARIALIVVAVVPEGDRLRISLTGTAPGGLARGRIGLTLLQERFSDQVNVVDARVLGHRAQLVFLRGDGPQALP